MSPKMPASVIRIASTTAIHPSGISSIAARVERGDDHDSGVARSSRAGTNRIVNAGPTTRGWFGVRGRVPRIQMLRSPFLSRMVVIVAVDTFERVSIAFASNAILIPSGRAKALRYQRPRTFHHASPTVPQIARWTNEIKNPTFHHGPTDTYPVE